MYDNRPYLKTSTDEVVQDIDTENEYEKAAKYLQSYISETGFDIPSKKEDIETVLAEFKKKFSPEILANLEDNKLLDYLFYTLGDNQDSLCCWLEMNVDCRKHFGSVAGGSAYKFGLFQKQKTGEWTTGSPQKPQVLTEDEALELGRSIRDALVTAAAIVQGATLNYTVSILEKKRAENNGQMPKYYVEGSHEAIIDKDVFLKVQAEMAKRANLVPQGKKRVYTSKYALSGMVFCGHCEDIYRRVYWNNRGKKKYVWRCVSRVLKKNSGIDCPARTIEETVLHEAVVTAVNDAFAQKNTVIPLLKQNIEEVINDDLEEKIKDIDKQLAELQIELINVSGDELAVERLGTEIVDLREERQDILTAAAERKDLQLRMQELIDFLDEQHTAITEYSETLTRRLVEKVTILDEKIVVTLKSGMEMEVEA